LLREFVRELIILARKFMRGCYRGQNF